MGRAGLNICSEEKVVEFMYPLLCQIDADWELSPHVMKQSEAPGGEGNNSREGSTPPRGNETHACASLSQPPLGRGVLWTFVGFVVPLKDGRTERGTEGGAEGRIR